MPSRRSGRRLLATLAGIAVLLQTHFAAATTGPTSAAGQAAAAYRVNCADCHGKTGKGDGPMTADRPWHDMPMADLSRKPRDFTRDYFRYGDSDAAIARTIAKGSRNTAMPGFPGSYPPAVVRELVRIVRHLRGPLTNAIIERRYPDRVPPDLRRRR